VSSSPRRALGAGIDHTAARQPPWHSPPWLDEPPTTTAAQALDAIAALRMVKIPAVAVESALHLARALLARQGEDPAIREAAEGLAAVLPRYVAAARPKPSVTVTPLRLAPAGTVSTTGRMHPAQPQHDPD